MMSFEKFKKLAEKSAQEYGYPKNAVYNEYYDNVAYQSFKDGMLHAYKILNNDN